MIHVDVNSASIMASGIQSRILCFDLQYLNREQEVVQLQKIKEQEVVQRQKKQTKKN